MDSPQRALADAFDAAVAACLPSMALSGRYPEATGGKVLLLGAGKPAAAMAAAAERHYRDAGVEVAGVVVTARGHRVATQAVTVLEASHPLPDAASVAAGTRLLAAAATAKRGDTVVCLIGGGGSALLCAPADVTLAEKVALTRDLMAAGADIVDLNVVRRHLSRIKGGGLAAALHPATVHALALSDVAGDDPADIAGGPTVADATTFDDALAVLDRYGIVAPAARASLAAGQRGERAETLKPGDPRLMGTTFQIAAGSHTALRAAAASLRGAGCSVTIEDVPEIGDAGRAAAERARRVAELLEEPRLNVPTALLAGGEVTVALTGEDSPLAAEGRPDSGPRGGPNCEYALAFAASLAATLAERHPPGTVATMLGRVCLLSADSDGIDGGSGLAGALFGPGQLAAMDSTELAAALATHDSGGFLRRAGVAFERGPTLTNVNDLRFVLVLPG